MRRCAEPGRELTATGRGALAVYLLHVRGPMAAAELAQALGVSPTHVYRLVDKLSTAVPVVLEGGTVWLLSPE